MADQDRQIIIQLVAGAEGFPEVADALDKALGSMGKMDKATDLWVKKITAAGKGIENIGATAKTLVSAFGQIAGIAGGSWSLDGVLNKTLQYSKEIIKLSTQWSKYGVGITELENRFVKLSNRISLTREDTINLFKTFEKGFPYATLAGAESMIRKISEATGAIPELITEQMNALQSVAAMYPELTSSVQNLTEADRERLKYTADLLVATGKLGSAQTKTLRDVINGNKQVSIQDKERIASEKANQKAVQDIRKTFEELSISIGTSLLPMFKTLGNFLTQHKKTIQDIGSFLGTWGIKIGIAIAGFKVLGGLFGIAKSGIGALSGSGLSNPLTWASGSKGGAGAGGAGVGAKVAAAFSKSSSAKGLPVWVNNFGMMPDGQGGAGDLASGGEKGGIIGSLKSMFGVAKGQKYGIKSFLNSAGGKMVAGAGLMAGGMAADWAGGMLAGAGHTRTAALVGGVGGAAMKGAGIGALLGPWGAAIGGGIGALVGIVKNWYNIFKSDADKKKQKQDEISKIKVEMEAQIKEDSKKAMEEERETMAAQGLQQYARQKVLAGEVGDLNKMIEERKKKIAEWEEKATINTVLGVKSYKETSKYFGDIAAKAKEKEEAAKQALQATKGENALLSEEEISRKSLEMIGFTDLDNQKKILDTISQIKNVEKEREQLNKGLAALQQAQSDAMEEQRKILAAQKELVSTFSSSVDQIINMGNKFGSGLKNVLGNEVATTLDEIDAAWEKNLALLKNIEFSANAMKNISGEGNVKPEEFQNARSQLELLESQYEEFQQKKSKKTKGFSSSDLEERKKRAVERKHEYFADRDFEKAFAESRHIDDLEKSISYVKELEKEEDKVNENYKLRKDLLSKIVGKHTEELMAAKKNYEEGARKAGIPEAEIQKTLEDMDKVAKGTKIIGALEIEQQAARKRAQVENMAFMNQKLDMLRSFVALEKIEMETQSGLTSATIARIDAELKLKGAKMAITPEDVVKGMKMQEKVINDEIKRMKDYASALRVLASKQKEFIAERYEMATGPVGGETSIGTKITEDLKKSAQKEASVFSDIFEQQAGKEGFFFDKDESGRKKLMEWIKENMDRLTKDSVYLKKTKQDAANIDAQALEKERERSKIIQKNNEYYEIRTRQADLLVERSNIMVNMTNNLATGLSQGVEITKSLITSIQGSINVYQEQLNIAKERLKSLDEGSADYVAARQQVLDLENKILQKQSEQLAATKNMRDGWIDAVKAMTVGSGRISKITMTAEKNVGLMKEFIGGVPTTYRSGSMKGGFAGSQAFTDTFGQMSANRTGGPFETWQNVDLQGFMQALRAGGPMGASANLMPQMMRVAMEAQKGGFATTAGQQGAVPIAAGVMASQRVGRGGAAAARAAGLPSIPTGAGVPAGATPGAGGKPAVNINLDVAPGMEAMRKAVQSAIEGTIGPLLSDLRKFMPIGTS